MHIQQLSISAICSPDALWSYVVNVVKFAPSLIMHFANTNKEYILSTSIYSAVVRLCDAISFCKCLGLIAPARRMTASSPI